MLHSAVNDLIWDWMIGRPLVSWLSALRLSKSRMKSGRISGKDPQIIPMLHSMLAITDKNAPASVFRSVIVIEKFGNWLNQQKTSLLAKNFG
jgi:hypothetical protein